MVNVDRQNSQPKTQNPRSNLEPQTLAKQFDLEWIRGHFPDFSRHL